MKGKYLIIGLLMLLFEKVNGQTCIHTNLSKKFDYKIERILTYTKEGKEDHSYSKLFVLILDKKTKSIFQEINIDANYLDETAYKDCENDRSYITHKNERAEVLDYNYGDIVVADLNFDGKEDFAVKRDSGGAGGPLYEFYVQNDKGVFIKDDYLSKHLYAFPENINPKTKTLTVETFATYTKIHEYVYKYNTSTQKWHLKTSKYLKV